MIEAMKQALEALEFFNDTSNSAMDKAMSEDAITLLRQAIAELESQEPHSWYSVKHDEWMTEKTRKDHERLNSYTHKVCGFDLPLYTHPPQRKPLTDEECLQIVWETSTVCEAIRKAEAAHGIKE